MTSSFGHSGRVSHAGIKPDKISDDHHQYQKSFGFSKYIFYRAGLPPVPTPPSLTTSINWLKLAVDFVDLNGGERSSSQKLN